MNKAKTAWWTDERGGAHMLLFALPAAVFAVLLLVVSLEWMLLAANKTQTKLALDRATHAASMHLNEEEAAYGRLEWEEAAGIADFYRYLQLNLRLDADGQPAAHSRFEQAPVVHLLSFVAAASYPHVVRQTVTVDAGQPTQTARNIEVTVYGPSVVAVIEVRQRVRGVMEPVVLSSVASVRHR